MSGFRRILFPVDFSPRCAGTVPFVKEMAVRHQATLTLLHVVEIPIYSYGGVPPEGIIAWDEFEENLKHGRQNLCNFADEQFGELRRAGLVELACDRGDPGYAIVAQAEKARADLIMMPTHGHGPFRSFLPGSATVRVLHRAKCAVWTGTHMEDSASAGHAGVRKILCAIDLERESTHVIACATELASAMGAEVRLVHCIPVPETGPSRDFLSEFDRFLAETACEKLAAIQKQAGTSYEISLEGGHIARVVREVAQHQGSDLVAIGRGHTHAPLSRLRSNAYAIVRDAPCPVLSI